MWRSPVMTSNYRRIWDATKTELEFNQPSNGGDLEHLQVILLRKTVLLMFSERGHANRVRPAVSMQHCCILQVIWECRRLVFRISLREYSFRCWRVWSVDITEWHKDCSLKRIATLVLLLFKTFTEFRLMMVTDGYTGVFLQLTNRHQCTLAKWGSSTVAIQASAVKKSCNKNVNTATCYGRVRLHHQFCDPGAL